MMKMEMRHDLVLYRGLVYRSRACPNEHALLIHSETGMSHLGMSGLSLLSLPLNKYEET